LGLSIISLLEKAMLDNLRPSSRDGWRMCSRRRFRRESLAGGRSETPSWTRASPRCDVREVQSSASMLITWIRSRTLTKCRSSSGILALMKPLRVKSSLRSSAQAIQKQADALYLEQWTDIWSSFPTISVNCSGCASIDRSGEIDEITDRSQRFLRLSKSASALLKKARRGKVLSNDRKLALRAGKLRDQVTDTAQTLPRFESTCK
jgi:hypothetical protein